MKHNLITSFFIFLLSIFQNTKINKLLTLVFVLLGPVLAIITFISADLFQKTTSPLLLRNLLLLDLIYVLIIAGLVAVRITRLILLRKSRTSGSRLHTRLTKVFTLIALLPTIIVAIFATVSINFGLEGWFSSNVQKVVENSMMAAKAYENEQKQYLVNDLNYLANVLNSEISKNRLIEEGYVRNVLSKFQPNSISESFIIDFTGDIRLRGERSYLFDFEKISNADIDKAISGQIVIIKDWPTNEFRAIKKLTEYNNRLLYVSRIVDGNILQLLDETQDTVLLYQQIENERYGLLFKFGLLYIAFSVVMILIAVWMALWFAEKHFSGALPFDVVFEGPRERIESPDSLRAQSRISEYVRNYGLPISAFSYADIYQEMGRVLANDPQKVHEWSDEKIAQIELLMDMGDATQMEKGRERFFAKDGSLVRITSLGADVGSKNFSRMEGLERLGMICCLT